MRVLRSSAQDTRQPGRNRVISRQARQLCHQPDVLGLRSRSVLDHFKLPFPAFGRRFVAAVAIDGAAEAGRHPALGN